MEILLSGITSIVLAFVSVYGSYAFLKAFQQRGYKKIGYLMWLYKDNGKYTSRKLNVTLLSVFSYILFLTLFGVFGFIWVSYLAFSFFVVFNIVYGHSQRKDERQKLEQTSRMKRLEGTLIVLNFAINWGLILFIQLLMMKMPSELWTFVGYSIVCLLTLVFPFLVIASDWIMYPIEKARRNHYKKVALAKLEKNKDVINIGITGSFGKTTVKNILGTILAEKYSVLITQKSYNTPMGIAKSLIEGYDGQEIFIAEMGARRKGEIKELAQFIPCKIGVITAVSRQHLEGFKTLDNIMDTKFELVENLREGGVMFFGGDNDGAVKLFERATCEKHMASVDKKIDGIAVSDMKVSNKGSSFVLTVGENMVEVSTRLLGKHNISNIVLAVSVANYLGLSIAQIKSGIEKIQSIPHRLELIESSNGVTVIDDSYNANPHGVKSACEVLKLFDGKKYVVTSGLVELGNMEKFENKSLGNNLANCTDGVILVGKQRALPIVEGLLENNYDKDNIRICDDIKEATEILSEILSVGDTVLFLNDLPDSYLA